MATFYCVGFHDLARTWQMHGHVSNHPIYLNEEDAILANKDKVTMVHEFYVRDCMFDSVISRLQQQYERLMSDFKKINIYGPGMGFIDWRVE